MGQGSPVMENKMAQRNFVAKHMNTFNRAATHRDRTKYSRNDFDMDEFYDEEDFGHTEQPAIANPKKFETSSISSSL